MNIFWIAIIAFIVGYCALSLIIGLVLKKANPDDAFEDMSYWHLVIIWPAYFIPRKD